MSTIICDDCGRQYNPTHPSCPACGTETVEAPTTKHAPEPWFMGSSDVTVIRPDGRPRRLFSLTEDGWLGNEDQANGTRLVACVNACHGVSDPRTALALARQALSSVKTYAETNTLPEGLQRMCADALRALGGT